MTGGRLASTWQRLWYTRLRDALRGRFDASLHWQTIVEQAELPNALADAVGEVIRRSRLWRSEKVAVAKDLIAHFQDGLAAGRTPEELLTAFGNPQETAQLIRRAKRRNRSVAWYMWHYGWMTIAALAVMYIALGLWMATGRPTVSVDYLKSINKMALAVPEDERAWPLYRDAFLAMGFQNKDLGTPAGDFLANDAKPGDVKWAEKEKFLSDHAKSIAKLRNAAGRANLGFIPSASQADFTDKDRELFGVKLTPQQLEAEKHQTLEDRWLIATLLPEIQYLRDAGTILATDARRAATAGDQDTAYADVIAMLGVSRHCEETPFLVCVLVAEAVQKQSRSVIHDILTQYPDFWTDGQLRDLAHQMAASRIDWRRGFEGERASFYDIMQRIYTDNGHGDGWLALQVTNDKNVFELIDSIASGGSRTMSSLSDTGIAMLTLPAANMVVASRKK